MPEKKEKNYIPKQENVQVVKEKLKDVLMCCQIYRIPFFAAIAESDNGEKTEYANFIHSAGANNIPLTEDHIRKHMLIANGFEPVPIREKNSLCPFQSNLYGD